jgi:hypothetical protein
MVTALKEIAEHEDSLACALGPMPDGSLFFQSDWHGCYRDGWKGLITEASFAHPAKYARGLIHRIYSHAFEQGWVQIGDTVADPFGGIALGGFYAAQLGLHFVGVELEEKFVRLGNENIAEWEHRYGHRPGYGSARLIQGDSRKLSEVLREAALCISSSPFGEALSGKGIAVNGYHNEKQRKGVFDLVGKRSYTPENQGTADGNLAALSATEAGLNLAISSPPYIRALGNASNYADPDKAKADADREIMRTNGGASADKRYSDDPANLGTMKEGDFSLAVSSPPFADSISLDRPNPAERRAVARDRGITNAEHISPIEMEKAGKRHEGTMGESEGQLGAMRDKGFDLSVSSPPFESVEGANSAKKFRDPEGSAERRSEGYRSGRLKGNFASKEAILRSMKKANEQVYGETDGNLGNDKGQDFWSAARQIVEEAYKVLAPGAHAIWAVKGFVRKGKYVDFPDQWRRLCEAVGFATLHWHNASLIERSGIQHTLDGGEDELKTERKSFFRRLAESKGSPAIDAEVVLCMVKER